MGEFLQDITRMARSLNNMPMRIRNNVAQAMAEETTALLQEQFDEGVDPSGDTWWPLKDGSASHLHDTGALQASVQAVKHGTNVVINANETAKFHQYGTERMVPRQIWPNEGEEMPDRWRGRIELAATSVLMDEARYSHLQAAE